MCRILLYACAHGVTLEISLDSGKQVNIILWLDLLDLESKTWNKKNVR